VRRRLIGAIVVVLVLLAAPSSPAATTVGAWFFHNGALARVAVPVPSGRSPRGTAVKALLGPAPPGYTTAIPAGVRLVSSSGGGGRASATFSSALGVPTRSAQAQIVSTLAQFPDADHVSLAVQGHGAVTLRGGDGRALAGGATPADYFDLTASAPIFVRSPARDSTVTSPVRLSGTADVFEATFRLDVRSGGRLVTSRTIHASSGTGTRGMWSTTLALPRGDVTLVLYEPSAKDGTPLHTTQVHLHVR
jgi:hypothetical protein